MSSDKTDAIGGCGRHLKYRADFAEWFHDPQRDRAMDVEMPDYVLAALEAAAERADRTFSAQLFYVLRVCRGNVATDFYDERTVLEWRDLIREMRMQLNEGGEWIPCSVVFPKAGI